LFKTRALQLQVFFRSLSNFIRDQAWANLWFSKEMGFSKAQSETAIKNSITVQAALESILKYSETDKCTINLFTFKSFGNILWFYIISIFS
jgi:hypothetical protein